METIGKIAQAETFAEGSGIRELNRLKKYYGSGNWRKRKGVAKVKIDNGMVIRAEFNGMKPMASVKRNLKSKTF